MKLCDDVFITGECGEQNCMCAECTPFDCNECWIYCEKNPNRKEE